MMTVLGFLGASVLILLTWWGIGFVLLLSLAVILGEEVKEADIECVAQVSCAGPLLIVPFFFFVVSRLIGMAMEKIKPKINSVIKLVNALARSRGKNSDK